MLYYVYILESLKNGRHYVGSTGNLLRRLTEHNEGKVKSTKPFTPWKIIYTEEYSSKTEALRRERKIKSYKGGIAFKKLISG